MNVRTTIPTATLLTDMKETGQSEQSPPPTQEKRTEDRPRKKEREKTPGEASRCLA